MGTLYLIPCWLEEHITAPLPAYLRDAVKACHIFFVENERSARRYLKAIWPEMVIDNYQWHPIHKLEETPEVTDAFRTALTHNSTVGIISEAGCPGIADPGQILTELAHQCGAAVRPLVGPSSILLALMASGLDGQRFAFHGYLPVDPAERTKTLRELEQRSRKGRETQIFIETPYRNRALLDALTASCAPSTLVTVAVDLTLESERIATRGASEWKKHAGAFDLHKRPAIFLMLAN